MYKKYDRYKMGQKENLDDYLKHHLEDGSGFEYSEADWLKAEKLIAESNTTKKAFFGTRYIVGVLAIIVAFFTFVINFKMNSNADKKAIEVPSNFEKSKNVEAENNVQVFENPTTKSTNLESKNIQPNQQKITAKNKNLSSNNNLTNEEKTTTIIADNRSDKAIVPNKNFIKHRNLNPFAKKNAASKKQQNNSEIKDATLLAAKEKEAVKTDGINLNETPDYAAAKDKKRWLDLKRMNIFANKNKEVYAQNYRNLSFTKRVINDSAFTFGDNKTDFAETSFDVKPKKPFTFEVIAGLGAFKAFAGNIDVKKNASIDPFAGAKITFFIKKNLSITYQLVYSQRRAINNYYLKNYDNGDFDNVVVNKLMALETPVYVNYKLSKHNACFGGVGMSFFVANQSNITSKNANPKNANNIAKGIKVVDPFLILGYQYLVSNKFNVTAHAQIGMVDITDNHIYLPATRDDNVSFRIAANYILFNRE